MWYTNNVCSFAVMVHRDMKLENILLSLNPKNSEDKFYIKVGDMYFHASSENCLNWR